MSVGESFVSEFCTSSVATQSEVVSSSHLSLPQERRDASSERSADQVEIMFYAARVILGLRPGVNNAPVSPRTGRILHSVSA